MATRAPPDALPGLPVAARPRRATSCAAALGVLLLAACAATPAPTAWDGRRGYDGLGDYGYDPEASRAEARTYRAAATGRYRVPGPPEDPWGPHVQEAAARFGIPERWIRAIMAAESGGRLYDAAGGLITSPVGAMGLMQVMPGTYDVLRARHRLGADPYEPRDNILAGAAYIRAMHDRFGAPGFVAAYNAGPERVEGVMSGATILPDETVTYLARVVPALGLGREAQATSARDAAGGLRTAGYDPSGAAYAGGGLVGGGGDAVSADDPSLRAYDGGGLVTPGYPTGRPR
ncbi:lytic transglycosylase domain-containing protein [Roseomonas sp. CCTCC AB2023176]|uniref:lytic transglycosylase domain-containing protein n=1 Tax=Roseomonas sp. CCTCC AB2023176 TaxID=3342640 RepID=UPI0035DF68EA